LLGKTQHHRSGISFTPANFPEGDRLESPGQARIASAALGLGKFLRASAL
jgi:hypothetical protein